MASNNSSMKRNDTRRIEKPGKLEKVDKYIQRLKRQAEAKAKKEAAATA